MGDPVWVKHFWKYFLACEKRLNIRNGFQLHIFIIRTLNIYSWIRSAFVQVEDKIILYLESTINLEPGHVERVKEVLASHNLLPVSLSKVDRIPVDARHNSKIDRPLLRQWVLEDEVTYLCELKWVIKRPKASISFV